LVYTVIIPPQELIKLGYPQDAVDCSGLKLTLDEVFIPTSSGYVDINSKSIPIYKQLSTNEDDVYDLRRGYYVIRYGEFVRIPRDSIAVAIPRSTLIRSGATIHTAVWDPGYEGRGYGLLIVFNYHGLKIKKGAQVAQLVFIKMLEESALQYRGSYFGER